MNPHADSVQRVGSTIYVLNARGHNRWSAQVQHPGRDDNDERISDSECESIAEALARFGTRPAAEPVSEIVKLQIEVDEASRAGEADPLQGAADWLKSAIVGVTVGDLQQNLLIGYNRAKRLFDAALSRQAPAAPAAVDFEQWWLAEVAANGGVPIGADYKHWAKKGFELRGDARAPAAPAEAGEALIERLKQEARIHAQEARTANATIAEIYQIVTGKTGEPGNWNGAEPVRKCIEELRSRLPKEQ